MSLFKTWAELRQESRYTRSKASGFNVSSAYVLKSDMDLPTTSLTPISYAPRLFYIRPHRRVYTTVPYGVWEEG